MRTSFASQLGFVYWRGLIGLVLALAGVFLALAGAGQNERASQADASDPCEPYFRSSCGRIVISIVGSGELPVKNPFQPGTPEYQSFDPLKNDALEYDAVRHLKQLSPLKDGNLPVQLIAVSSDEGFSERANNLLKHGRGVFHGIEPNSIESIQLLARGDSKLRQAIHNLESDPRCRELIVSRNLKSVIPLIKFEFAIEDDYAWESREPGIRTWSSSDKKGSKSEWIQDGKNVITKELWNEIVNNIRGGVTHTFFNSCESGRVMSDYENIATTAGCSCFLASTGKNQKDYSGGAFIPTFNNAIKDLSQFNSKADNSWEGASDIYSMVPAIYNKYSPTVFPKDGRGDPYRYIDIANPRNPLVGFVYTSADALAEDALMKLGNISDESVKENPHGLTKNEVKGFAEATDGKFTNLPRQIYYAQFTDDLPQIGNEIGGSNAMVARINDQIEGIKRKKEFAAALKDETARLSAGGDFEKYFGSFAGCAFQLKDKVARKMNAECKSLDMQIDEIFNKVDPSDEEMKFMGAYGTFMDTLKASDPRQSWRDHIANKKPLGEVFEPLYNVNMAYRDVREKFAALNFHMSGEAKQIDPQSQQAFDKMTKDFDAAFASIQQQVFRELSRDALQLKLAKIMQATRLVAQHPDALPPGYADNFLKNMSSKLNCLTQYAVGPKFDQQQAGPIANARTDKKKISKSK